MPVLRRSRGREDAALAPRHLLSPVPPPGTPWIVPCADAPGLLTPRGGTCRVGRPLDSDAPRGSERSRGMGADRHLTGVPSDLRLPVPLPGGCGGPCARLRRSVTVAGMTSEQRAPAWLTGPCAGGPRPAWLTGKERRPRVTMQEAPGWAIAAALAALRKGRRSSRGGPPRAGETAFVGAMMRGGVRPTLFPACLRAAALSDRRGVETRRRSAMNWLRRHVAEGLGMLTMRRTWRRERPQDFVAKRRLA